MAYPASKPCSLYDVFCLYKQAIQTTKTDKQARNTLTQLQSLLLRYLLPHWGFPAPQGTRLTIAQQQTRLENLKQVPLEELYHIPEIQSQYLEMLHISDGNKRNQRYLLNSWLKWCQSQAWWNPSKPVPVGQRKRRPSKSAAKVRISNRPSRGRYGLKTTCDAPPPATLQQELDRFYQFRINPPSSTRTRAITPGTATQELAAIDLLLGWLHNYEHVPVAQLSLNALVALDSPQTTLDTLHRYKQWLNSAGSSSSQTKRNTKTEHPDHQSLHGLMKVIAALIALTKYQYCHQAGYERLVEYKSLPLIQLLRAELNQIQHDIAQSPSATDYSRQWLDWAEFLALVEALRLECDLPFPNQETAKQTLAQRYQRFLIVALFAYIPPFSSQAYRYLRFLPGKPTPSESFLYRRGTLWWMKVERSRADRLNDEIPVPDIQYPDGRSFYQYLNAWLYGSSSNESAIRDYLNPQHPYVFTKLNGGAFENSVKFMEVIQNVSYRLTERLVTPRTIRNMFMAYVLEQYPDLLPLDYETVVAKGQDQVWKLYNKLITPEMYKELLISMRDLAQASVLKK
jgi:hypothetical protein